jgi:ribonuclease HII
MARRFQNRFKFERALFAEGHELVAGVDEAGRGPLAGPGVAAAGILPPGWCPTRIPRKLAELNDSKQLTAAQRDEFFALLTANHGVRFGIAQVDAAMVDQINILQATHRAMRQAIAQIEPPPQHVLVDGLPVPHLGWPHTALVEGDARSYSIAAASVLAKVTRDRLMRDYDRLWPQYGFAEHKGYGTEQHLAALAAHGPCPIHRRTFSPLRAVAQLDLLTLTSVAPVLPDQGAPALSPADRAPAVASASLPPDFP